MIGIFFSFFRKKIAEREDFPQLNSKENVLLSLEQVVELLVLVSFFALHWLFPIFLPAFSALRGLLFSNLDSFSRNGIPRL